MTSTFTTLKKMTFPHLYANVSTRDVNQNSAYSVGSRDGLRSP